MFLPLQFHVMVTNVYYIVPEAQQDPNVNVSWICLL